MSTVNGSKRVGVAFFGAGWMGSVHFRHLVLDNSWRVDVRWVVDEDVEKARTLVAKYPLQDQIRSVGTEEADKAFNDPRVGAVVVCTPAFTHEHIVKASLAAGKAVFCEKPLAPTTEAIESCYDAAAQKNLSLFCAFSRRFDPQRRMLYNRIRSGEVGKPRVIKTTSRDPPAMIPTLECLAMSSGVFLESAVHDIDLVCWLAGDEPVSVYAAGHATNPWYTECGDVDSCVVTLRFAGGAIGSIEMSRDALCGYDQRVEVLCTQGMLQSGNKRPTEVSQWTPEGTITDPIYMGIDRYEDSYRLELDHFLDVLQGKANLGVTASEVVMVNRIALACRESVKTGKVIQL